MEAIKTMNNVTSVKAKSDTKDKKKVLGVSIEAFREERAAWLFLLPMLLGLGIFFFYPFVQNIIDSFYYGEQLMMPEFVGFDNYIKLFQDEVFLRTVINSFIYVIVTVPIIMALGIALSVFLHKKIKGSGLYRTLIFFPLVTTSAAVAMVWRWLLNTNYGIVNAMLNAIGLGGQPWLTEPTLAFISCCIVIIWSSVSYQTIILLAGLQNISPSYYEAAEIDGATSSQQFFRITLPLLTPTLYFVLTVIVIAMFKQFEIVYMLVPADAYNTITPQIEATRTIVRYFYDIAFRDATIQFGYPSAVAMGLFVIILVVTLVQNKIQKKWVYQD